MGMTEQQMRIHPLDGRRVANVAVTLTPAAPAARVSLRAGDDAVAALSKALGLKLPTAPKTCALASVT